MLAVSLVFASMAGLLACPQLLSDDFDSLVGPGDDSCARRQTCAGAGGSSGAGALTAGAGGTTLGSGGSAHDSGASGAAGAGFGGSSEAGSGGSDAGGSDAGGSSGMGGSNGGTGGSGGNGGNGGSDESDASVDPPGPPACWLVELDDTTHDASSNCLGINGWNQVVTEPLLAVDLTYEDGAACLTGTIASDGWAVYNFTLNDEDPWGGQGAEVGGFQFDAIGTSLPPELRIIYDDDDDGEFCRIITPGPGVQVPFASAHPGCSTTSGSVPDATDLTLIRFAIDPAASDYDIDFCLSIRAIP